MGQFLQGLPKMLLGSLAVVGVLLFMYISEPPVTICDVQLETVRKKLNKDFLRRSREKFGAYDSPIGKSYEYCLKSNSTGGCYDLFRRLIIFERQVRTLPTQCGDHEGVQAFRSWLIKGVVLMSKIAWGEEPPKTLYEKKGWLEEDQVALFCRMKREYGRLYGKAAWNKLRDGALQQLPQAKSLTRKDLWEKSLFSLPCRGYL